MFIDITLPPVPTPVKALENSLDDVLVAKDLVHLQKQLDDLDAAGIVSSETMNAPFTI